MDPKSYAQFMAMKEQEARAAAAAAEAAKPKPSAPARAVAPKAAKPSAGLAPAKSVAQAPPPKQTSTSAAPVVTPPAQPATQKPKVDPDLLQDLKVEDLYRVARDLPEVNASILAIRPQTNLSIPRYRELAAIHSIDLDDLHKSARSGMPFENYKKAKKDAIGFLPADQRATRFDEVVKDYETAQKGEIRTDKRLDLAPAEEAPATIKGFTEGYVIGNTSTEETPEVAKEGEHYYAIAQAYLKAVDSSPEVVKLVDLYANSLAGGATQQYINERTKQIMKNKGIGPGSPDADRQAALARRQALYDVLARKTVGQWTPGIFVKDVQVTDDAKATDNPFAALGPNVELIGFNNKGNAVFRQESPAGVALRTLDVIGVVPVPGKKLLPIPGQSVITGLVSKKDNETYSEAVSRGVSTGANWLELALDATKEQPLPLRAAAGVAGLGAAIIHPDVTAAAGSLGDAARAARVARINKQVAKEAVPLLEELVTAYKANDFEKAEKVEKKIAASELLGRSKQHSVVKAFNRADAAFIEALAAIDPTVKSLDPFLVDNLVAQVARRNPQLVEFIYESAGKGAPHMHFAKAAPELAARGKSGEAEATMMSFLDAGNFPRRKQRIELARAAYLKSVPKTAEEALTKGTDDLIQSIRGRANDARVMGVPEADVARDLRLADLMEQYKADLLEDPTSWQKEDGAFRTALREDPVTGGDAGKEFRAKSYRTDISRAVKRTQALKEVDYDTVLKEDMRVFDDALRAVDTNVKSRIMAAESLRRNLADKAEIRITPIDILDDLKDPGTERLSPMAQATFLTTMRQLPPEADRADWMRTFQALDAGLRGVAQRTGKSVEEVWRDILVQVQKGEGELAKAIKREASKAPAPAPGAPPAAAVTPPAPPPSTTPTVPNTPEIQAAVDKVAKGGKAGPAPKLNPRTVELVAKLDEKLQAKPDNVSKILSSFDKLGPGAAWPTIKGFPGQTKQLVDAIREQLLESGDLVKLEDGTVVKAGGTAAPAPVAAPVKAVEPAVTEAPEPVGLAQARVQLSELSAQIEDTDDLLARAQEIGDIDEEDRLKNLLRNLERTQEILKNRVENLKARAPAPKVEAPAAVRLRTMEESIKASKSVPPGLKTPEVAKLVEEALEATPYGSRIQLPASSSISLFIPDVLVDRGDLWYEEGKGYLRTVGGVQPSTTPERLRDELEDVLSTLKRRPGDARLSRRATLIEDAIKRLEEVPAAVEEVVAEAPKAVEPAVAPVAEAVVEAAPVEAKAAEPAAARAQDLATRGSLGELEAPLTVTHRTSSETLDLSGLDPLAERATRQGKRGKSAKVGLYTYGPEVTDAEAAQYGARKIDIQLPAGTKVLDVTALEGGTSARITKAEAEALLAQGVQVIRGKDVIGPPEYVILDQSLLKAAPAPALAPAPVKAAKAPRGKKATAAVPAPAPVPEAPAPVTAPVAAPAPVVRAAPVPKTIENLGNASIWKKVKAPLKGLPESLETDVSGVKFRINAVPTDAGKAPEFRVVMKLGEEVESLGGKFASMDEALAAMPSLRADIDAFVRKQMPGAAEAGKKPRGRGRQKIITEPEVTPAKAEEVLEEPALDEIVPDEVRALEEAAPAVEETAPVVAAAAPTLTVAEKLEKVKDELRKVTHSAFRDDVQVFGRVDDEGNFVPMYELSGAEAAGGRSAEALYNKVLGGMGSPENPTPLAKSGAKPVSVEPVIKKLDRMADEGDLYQTGVVEAEKLVGRLVEKGKIEFLTPQQIAELRDQDAPTAVITLFRGVADPTTLVHEVGHYIRKMALDQSDMDAITQWIKSKGVDVEHKFGDFTGSAEDVRQAEELFAQAFEEYLALGKAPTPQLEALFQKVKEVFAKVYRTLSRGPLGEEIDKDVKAVFDRLFTEVPEKPPETTFDLIMRQTFNNKGLEPEGGLTVLARESKRRGIDSVTYLKKGDTVATKYPTTEEGLAKLVAQAYQDMGEAGWSGGTIIKFPTNVFGKSEWTGADIVEMSTRVQTRRNDFELAPLKQALFGDPEEETATENIFRAVEQREETGPFKGLKTVARGAGRGLAHSVLGGDITQERAVRNLLPAVRRNLDTSVRIVEQAIGDTISVLSQTIRTGEMDFLYRYLAGDTGLVYSSGRRVISSGHEFIDGFLDLYRNAGNSLTQDERALLQDLANAINTRPLPGNLVTPQQRSEALARLVYPDLDDLDTDVKNPIRQAMQARATAMQDALEKFRSLRGSGDKGVGSQLAKAMKSASKEGTPSINEYRFAETLLYLSGITARNGEMFVPVGKNYSNDQLKTAAQILLDDAQKIYGSDTDQLFARRLAILVGAYGAASRAKAELAELGLVLRREEAFAYNNWVLGYTVEPEMRVRLEGVMRKLGANTQFTADTILGADVYIPTQARERIAEALGKAQFSEQRLTKMGDMYQMAYAFMKKRMTRGNFVLRQRYFMVNTIDHFFQMSLIVGYGPAFQSVARIALQNAMASLPGQLAEMMLRAGSRITNGRLDPAYIEKFRDLLSRGGDKVAGSLREMMGGSKYRVEVNHILEGRNMPIILGGHVTTAKRLREIMVAEGILESYNTRRLGAVIRQEGTAFINDGDGFIQAGIDDRTLGGNVATGWAKVRDAAADMTVNVVDDIGDAWAERERVGAAVTLIETGIEPRAACRLTVDALYDYAQSMTKMDRNLLWGLLFPFWAFQKNANQQFINVLSRPYGAYRMMVLKRFRDRGGELLTELYYDAVGGELGLDVNSMPQDMQDLYYAIMTQAHEVYGDEIPEDAKLALRLALTGRSAEVVQGKYYELDASLIDMLRSGGVAGVGGVAMSEYMLPRPDRAGLPSYVRDRPGVLLAQRRNALVRLYSGLSGKNDKMFFLMMPEASFESAMKHTSSVLATSMLMAGYVSSAIPGSKALGLTERGLQGTDILQAIKPVIDLERSPIAGPVINLYAQRGYPKRVHPAIAKIMMDMMDVPILRVPAVDDPFENEQFIQEMETPDENGQPRDIAQILGADRVRSIQELNDRDIDPTDVSRIREERYYLPPGGYSIAFENSPFLGEFNTELLNKLAASPAEQADAAGKVLYAARLLTGLEVSEVSASRTAQMEEPVFYTKSQKPF